LSFDWIVFVFKITVTIRILPQGWDCCCDRPTTEADKKNDDEVNN
jgi:hypothetical protein